MLSTLDTGQLEVGHLAGVDADGRPLVRVTLDGREVVEAALLAVSVTESQMQELIADEQQVLLARPSGLAGAPVVIGVLRDRPLADPEVPREMVLEASERLVVRCGEARMVLHGDGRCEVHAERISQRARGVHAIKGAAVRIN